MAEPTDTLALLPENYREVVVQKHLQGKTLYLAELREHLGEKT